ncbi:MAG: aminotransferase class III-fold pyridoxal phosphate-dependent enzyme [Pseudomonadota bacterium]|nr:aminotransferase class III-fold pyridoxal phosphate-dependent enzyme [Pseudomonadota bacterium]
MRFTNRHDNLANQQSVNECRFANDSVIDRAEGIHVYMGGQRFIDLGASNPYNLLGHHHKLLNQALTNNLHMPATSTRWQAKNITALTLALEQISPNGFQARAYFNHPNIAMHHAMITIKQAWHQKGETQRNHYLSFAHASSEDSIHTINLTTTETMVFQYTPLPYTWIEDPSLDTKENLALIRLEQKLKQDHDKLLAFVIEPCISSLNGMFYTRASFLDKAIQLAKSYHLPIVSDERFLAPYRTGLPFGSMHLKEPTDFIILGSTITNGIIPFGAILHHGEGFNIDRISPPKHDLNLYPFTADIAIQCLETMCSRSHTSLLNQIIKQQALKAVEFAQIPILDKVRQHGLMLAFDLVCEKQNQQAQVAHSFIDRCRNQGLLITQFNKSLSIIPPVHKDLDLNHIYHTLFSVIHDIPLHDLASTQG